MAPSSRGDKGAEVFTSFDPLSSKSLCSPWGKNILGGLNLPLGRHRVKLPEYPGIGPDGQESKKMGSSSEIAGILGSWQRPEDEKGHV